MAEITLRFATAEDAGILLALVRELAIFEKAPDAVLATEADLRRHGFGPEPRFEALLAFVDGRAAGFALFFPNFSTWRGRPNASRPLICLQCLPSFSQRKMASAQVQCPSPTTAGANRPAAKPGTASRTAIPGYRP